MHHDVCVISCYGVADPGNVGFLNALDEALDARGIRLLVLATQQNEALRPLSIEIPYLFSGFDAFIDDACGGRPFHPLEPNLLSEEVQGHGCADEDAVGRGIAKCEAVYGALGRLVSPCAAFLWNTTLPHGRVARNTLLAAGIPAYCIERGWLPGTYQLHTLENNAYNNFFTDFSLNRRLASAIAGYGSMEEPFASARRYYGDARLEKYTPQEPRAAGDLRRKYGLGDGPLVAVFCASEGSSVAPHGVPSMAYSSPHFDTVGRGLELLASQLAPYPGVQVLVQEHPIQRAIGRSAALPPGFVATRGESIHALLEAADRVAFIGTTTVQAEALLLDKPRLSMSRHPASLVGASYGLVEMGLDAVPAWMQDSHREECAFAARGLVNFLCREELIRAPGLPGFVERGVDDLAAFVAGLARPARALPEERLGAFVAQLDAMLHRA